MSTTLFEPIVGPLDPVHARNDLARAKQRPDFTPEIEQVLRGQLAAAKIDKAIDLAMEACPVPLSPAQVAYLCGVIREAGEKR